MTKFYRDRIKALSVIDQASADLWVKMLELKPPAAIARVLRRGDLDEVRNLPEDQLRVLLGLAYLGHTYVCWQKMGGDSEQ